MTKWEFVKLALLFIATQAGVEFAMQYVVPGKVPRRWEYRTRYLEPGKDGMYYGADLAGLGKKGWELITVVPSGQQQMCLFKKPIFTGLGGDDDDDDDDD